MGFRVDVVGNDVLGRGPSHAIFATDKVDDISILGRSITERQLCTYVLGINDSMDLSLIHI